MDEVKVLAVYLPQFHQVKENDEWWGEGYTEWTAVKAAEPLFEGHNQPRNPLGDYCYDLLDKSAMEWQSKLAKEYGVYGFCFYHYWFEKGKRILEKPAENLLRWKDIEMNYCFYWANESWARSWETVVGGNAWSEKFEKANEININQPGMLLKQGYGRESDWKEHFEYLLPFFKDSRYIKVDDKPVFMIYRADLMRYCISQMLRCWKRWAEEAGLPGLYIISANQPWVESDMIDAMLEQEPTFTLGCDEKKYEVYEELPGGGKVFSYDDAWRHSLDRKRDARKKIFLGGFTDFDTTPRRGRAGRICSGVDTEKFKKYFTELVRKSIQRGNEFVFLNAWNEWAEGMYMEPDTTNGYGFLEAVRDVLNKEDLYVQGECSEGDGEIDEIYTRLNNKFRDYFHILSRWLEVKQRGGSIVDYFRKHHYNSIAIYGLGVMGKHLYEDLKNTDIEIKYAIDRGAESSVMEVRSPDQELPKVDVVVVTPVFDYPKIEKGLSEYIQYPIISLSEVVDECGW